MEIKFLITPFGLHLRFKEIFKFQLLIKRSFIGFNSRTLLFIILPLLFFSCKSKVKQNNDRIMPGGSIPTKLSVLTFPSSLSWEERNMLSCYQGLINRNETRIYYVETEQDKFWLDYYEEEFNIETEEVDNINELLRLFSNEIEGYILYDLKNPHFLNIATTIGAIKNLLPVPKSLESIVQDIGLVKADEVETNGLDRLELYRNALDQLLPECNQEILGALCVHFPHWPTSTVKNRDYIIAHKIFSFDLSSSERDKNDYKLLKEIYSSTEEGAIIMGWHCVRDKEHEAIGLASEFGHYGMCNLNTSNLTVHSSIPLPKNKIFSQRNIEREKLSVEDKIYISFMATDGDASWFMANLISTDWSDPAHGKFKYNWGFLPLAYDLMPGTVKYYLDNMKSTDYFVAGPAGATYTYPYLHPDPSKFLKLSNEYMKKCGLTTVHMTNWNDRDWWQEVEISEFYPVLQEYLTNSIGFVRGMGESAFEENFLGDGKPFIFCGEGIHKGDDVYKTMKDFIDACPNRPLFIYSLVNHSVPIGEIKAAMDKFDQDNIEIVHLDELLILADKAYKEGKITAELYPDKSKIKEILINDAKNTWSKFFDDLTDLQSKISGKENEYVRLIKETPAGVEPIVAGDHLSFTTVWNSMTLVKLTLEAQGHYVNNKRFAADQFLKTYGKFESADVVKELFDLWQSWHERSISYKEAQLHTNNLYKLAKEIDRKIMK